MITGSFAMTQSTPVGITLSNRQVETARFEYSGRNPLEVIAMIRGVLNQLEEQYRLEQVTRETRATARDVRRGRVNIPRDPDADEDETPTDKMTKADALSALEEGVKP